MTADRKKAEPFCGFIRALAVLTFVLLCSVPADATLITSDTNNAMPGYFGTATIQFEEDNGKFVDGSIDFAVYDKGHFNSSFPGQDPSNGTRYVYRYQLYNNSSATSTDYMKLLTVGLAGDGDTQAANCTWIDPGIGSYPSGGVVPTSGASSIIGTPATSVVWSFQSPRVQPNTHSYMLIFTSPFSPKYRTASVNSSNTPSHYTDNQGGQHNQWWGQVPSPIPEPASWISLAMFCGFLLAYKALLWRK
jgi:hypothetical protein